MPAGLSGDERVALLISSLEKNDWLSTPAKATAPTTEETPTAEQEVAPWAVNPSDITWNDGEPALEEDEPQEEESQSLRLQKQFLDEHGYNWWSPPPDKISVKGYRPPTNRPQPPSGDVTDVDLTPDPRCGEPAPRGLKFTPFAAICKFPYKFVSAEWRQPFATAIFDNNKIQNRAWDLYYVYSDIACPKPCLFVPESQFQNLLDEINESFPDAHIGKDEGLVFDFSEVQDSDLRPRWLGQSTSRTQTDRWPELLDCTISKHDTMSKTRDVELFKQKMQEAFEMGQNKKKAAKKAKQEVAVKKRQVMVKELARAQQYLQLVTVNQEEQREPIFIAIDVEAWEDNPNVITEVGVATLDTRDLRDVPPGMNGEGWQGAIRARHFRIAEYLDKINHRYVQGCPNNFEFGESEINGKDKIGSKLTSCFHAPFSADHMVDKKTFGDKIDAQAGTVEEGEERRNIIFLGHDVDNDIAYLHKIGFDPLNRGNLLETMDTRTMYSAYNQDQNPTSLGRILAAFDQTGWHLHNAGNDAVYTVWALLAMSVASASETKPEAEERRAKEYARRESNAVEEVKERVRDGAEGWGDPTVVMADEAKAEEKVDEKVEQEGGDGAEKGSFVPWQGSESGFYTKDGYPINV